MDKDMVYFVCLMLANLSHLILHTKNTFHVADLEVLTLI